MPEFTIIIVTHRASDTLGSSTWYAWADCGIVGIGDSEASAVKNVLDALESLYHCNIGAIRTK